VRGDYLKKKRLVPALKKFLRTIGEGPLDVLIIGFSQVRAAARAKVVSAYLEEELRCQCQAGRRDISKKKEGRLGFVSLFSNLMKIRRMEKRDEAFRNRKNPAKWACLARTMGRPA